MMATYMVYNGLSMSSELSPGDRVFLAFLARGPMSAYDIKKEMASSVSFFWSAQHSQVYQQANRLQRQGYVEPRGRAGARNRVILGLTDQGWAAVGEWLREPAPTYRIYDQSLAKLYFADLADPDTARQLLAGQRDQHQALLAEFDRLRGLLAGVDYQQQIPYQLYTLQLGIRVEQAYLDWIASTLADLAARSQPGELPGRRSERPQIIADPAGHIDAPVVFNQFCGPNCRTAFYSAAVPA